MLDWELYIYLLIMLSFNTVFHTLLLNMLNFRVQACQRAYIQSNLDHKLYCPKWAKEKLDQWAGQNLKVAAEAAIGHFDQAAKPHSYECQVDA